MVIIRLPSSFANNRTISTVLKVDELPVNNSTAFVNTKIVLPVKANKAYAMFCYYAVTSDFNADWKVVNILPAGCLVTHGLAFIGANASLVDFDSVVNWSTTGTIKGYGLTGAFQTGATAGNVVIQYAQRTAVVLDTTMHALSHMTLIESEIPV